jgi:hypothetical protein
MPSPSLMQEGVIALVRDNPAFAASLLRELLHVEVLRFDEARLTEAALNQLVPVEYHADAVVLFIDFIDKKKKPVLGTIFEVQLERKERKRYTWPLYAVAARARHESPFVLTVVTPDPAVARWAGHPIDLGNGIFVPRVIGPEGIAPPLLRPRRSQGQSRGRGQGVADDLEATRPGDHRRATASDRHVHRSGHPRPLAGSRALRHLGRRTSRLA